MRLKEIINKTVAYAGKGKLFEIPMLECYPVC